MKSIKPFAALLLISTVVKAANLDEWVAANPVEFPSDIRSEAWWNKEQSGWGVFTSVFGDATTAFWYTYDENGKPTWFIFNDLRKGQDGYYSGKLTKHRGIAYNADANSGRGLAAEEFADTKVAYSVGPFDGREVQNALVFAIQERTRSEITVSHHRVEAFDINERKIYCRQDANMSRVDAKNYSDIYWNPDNAGWGLQLMHFGSQLVGVWYTYDESGAATFFTMVLNTTDGKNFSGEFYANPSGVPFTQVSSSIWGSTPNSAVSSEALRVGEVYVSMNNGQEGTFRFVANGKTSTQRITRFRSGNTANYCEDSKIRGDYWSAEPALRERDDVLYFGGYEAGGDDNVTWGETAGAIALPDQVGDTFRSGMSSITTSGAFRGRSLRVRYPAGGTWGYGYETKLTRLGLNQEGYDRLFMRYYVRFEEAFEFSRGGKLPGLGGFNAPTGCIPATGENGFSMRYMWRENGRAILYPYIPHTNFGPIGCGYNIQLEVVRAPPLNSIPYYFSVNRWICIEQEVRLNDVSVDNGYVKVWINGLQVLDLQGITYRTVDNLANKIGQIVFTSFYGGDATWGPSVETFAQFDNFVLAENRIGCL